MNECVILKFNSQWTENFAQILTHSVASYGPRKINVQMKFPMNQHHCGPGHTYIYMVYTANGMDIHIIVFFIKEWKKKIIWKCIVSANMK